MRKRIIKRASVFLAALLACLIVVPSTAAFAVTEIKDDTDLAHVQAYQFTMTQANMEVLSQSGDVEMDVLPPEAGREQSTVFALKVDKANRGDQSFNKPLRLKF